MCDADFRGMIVQAILDAFKWVNVPPTKSVKLGVHCQCLCPVDNECTPSKDEEGVREGLRKVRVCGRGERCERPLC